MKISRVLIGIFILVICFLVLNRDRLHKLLYIKEQYELFCNPVVLHSALL